MMENANHHSPEVAAWWREKRTAWGCAALGVPRPEDDAAWEKFAEEVAAQAKAAGIDLSEIGARAEERVLRIIAARNA
jgi:hypothetical protein